MPTEKTKNWSDTMYLKEISIQGFRCFKDHFTARFSNGLNVIVGENGAGKTTIINSIRQLLQDSESGLYNITEDDFHREFAPEAQPSPYFSIVANFCDLEDEEKINFLPWTGGTDTALLNLYVENKESRGRYKRIIWGGKSKSTQFENELIDSIHCIYLPPLRDAESKLSNGRQSRLSKLLRALNRKELRKCKKDNQPHPLESSVKEFNYQLAINDDFTIKKANELIKAQLKESIGSHFSQNTVIQFAENDFTKIVENLRLLFFPNLSTSDHQLFRSLSQNSLGYNNLLYIASVLAELTLDDQEPDQASSFKILLIEEPEAHLHPQLQIRLLSHLKQVAEKKSNNVQVIVTTHSTVLAASVSIDSIIHLSKGDSPVATPLNTCALPTKSKNFINRWLDVTKSNLMFASGVILVEGIAEQMVIPELAKSVLNGQPDGRKNLEDQGISVINMNGIYFNHFMRLYSNFEAFDDEELQKGEAIPIRCAGVTDRDPPRVDSTNDGTGKPIKVQAAPYEGNISEGSNPAIKLADAVSTSRNVRIYVSKFKTFEYDLAMEGNNAAIMAKIISSLWPAKTESEGSVKAKLKIIQDTDWTQKTSQEKAGAAFELLKRIENKDVGKGIFAQTLSDQLSLGLVSLIVPQYLKDAISWAASENVTETKL